MTTRNPHPITPKRAMEIERAVQQAIANQELEGNILDAQTIANGYAMLDGRMTIEEFIADAVARCLSETAPPK